jgi:hypothetical protein
MPHMMLEGVQPEVNFETAAVCHANCYHLKWLWPGVRLDLPD